MALIFLSENGQKNVILKSFACGVLLLFLFACAAPEKESTIIDLISENKSKWRSWNILTYSFELNRTPVDCPLVDAFPPVEIIVNQGEVSTVYVPSLGAYEDADNWPSIDDLFKTMLNEASDEPRVFSLSSSEPNALPQFDAQYGFPSRYYVDLSAAECDATDFQLNNFQTSVN